MPPKKTNKYNSLDRGGGAIIDENEVSPMVMKKKANVHLEPMSHKKAPHYMPGGLGAGLKGHPTELSMGHSESNPMLAPGINDRVKLEKLNHIPSVKSNLMQSDTMSQGTFDALGASGKAGLGLNYEAMPVGKKSVLAPINVLNS